MEVGASSRAIRCLSAIRRWRLSIRVPKGMVGGMAEAYYSILMVCHSRANSVTVYAAAMGTFHSNSASLNSTTSKSTTATGNPTC